MEGGDKDRRTYHYVVNGRDYYGAGRCRYPHGSAGESIMVWYSQGNPNLSWPSTPCFGHPNDGLLENILNSAVVGLLQWLLFGIGGLMVFTSNFFKEDLDDKNQSEGG